MKSTSHQLTLKYQTFRIWASINDNPDFSPDGRHPCQISGPVETMPEQDQDGGIPADSGRISCLTMLCVIGKLLKSYFEWCVHDQHPKSLKIPLSSIHKKNNYEWLNLEYPNWNTFYDFIPTKYLVLCKPISVPTFTKVHFYYQL